MTIYFSDRIFKVIIMQANCIIQDNRQTIIKKYCVSVYDTQ